MALSRISIKVIVTLGIILLALIAALLVQGDESVQQVVASYGYSGVFFVSIISGFNIISAVPVIAFIPVFIAAGLSQWVLVVVMAIGVTLADVISFFIADVGKQLMFSRIQKAIMRLESLRVTYHTSPLVVLFVFASIAPLPNELLIIPMVFLGYRLRQIMLPVLAGNVVFMTLSTLGVVGLFNAF